MDEPAETQARHPNSEQQKRREERGREKDSVKNKELEKEEKQQVKQELNVLEEKAKKLRDGK